jgi:hypothetical protein
MQLLLSTFPTVAVASVYCLWNAYRRHAEARERVVCRRVAYMLWVMATESADCFV